MIRPRITAKGIEQLLSGKLKGRQREDDPGWFDFDDMTINITPQAEKTRIDLLHKGQIIATFGDVHHGLNTIISIEFARVTVGFSMD